MFLKHRIDLFQRLSFRLTLWYSIIFTLCALVLLMIFYTRVAYITRAGVDEELAEEAAEFAEVMRVSGLSGVAAAMQIEENSEAPGAMFWRLLSFQGEVLAASDPTPWGGEVPLDRHKLLPLTGQSEPHFETLDLDGHPYQMRTIYQTISPEAIMQIGFSLEKSEDYLDIFRQLLIWILAPVVLLSAAVGWFMAHQALADVDTVARTAEEISRGHSNKRVKLERHFVEVDRLANSFNTMVDQLHALISQMREMTDNIAHDLRSPLTRIRGFAEMTLIGKSSPADFQDMAVNTVEECDNLIHMINTMLDIAEAESGIAPIAPEPVELQPLIDDACTLFSSLASEKHIRLHQEVPDTAVILSDRSKLQRMITNLLENAIKYTPSRGRVSVSVQLEDWQARIQVSDTGIGIAPDEQPKIFQRFYRCDTSRTEAGMGLGLSLVKALAESLGGSLSVESASLQGSTFTLCMPTSSGV
jgi:signal transduction histidine kinase